MKRYALAALPLAALKPGMIDGRSAAAQPGAYRLAPQLVEVQHRPSYRQDRRYHRQERRAGRRAWLRERERQVARRAYRAGRRDRATSRRY